MNKKYTYSLDDLKNAIVSSKCVREVLEKLGIVPAGGNYSTFHKHENNNLDNLELLCPNCHALTENYRGKKLRLPKKSRKRGDPNWRTKPKLYCRKVERPDYETLKRELSESNYCVIARKYGVSDNAIRKWLKFYEKNQSGDIAI